MGLVCPEDVLEEGMFVCASQYIVEEIGMFCECYSDG